MAEQGPETVVDIPPDPGVEDPGEPIIRLRNIVKRFGSQTVLEDINLDVYPGETIVIMGGSGSGKSTTLRVMIGSIRPDSGSVEMFGQNVSGLKEDELNEVRKKFGILFQSGALFNSMTVYENVALPIREHTNLDEEIIDLQVKIKLQQVSLLQAADKYPAQISGGMKKRAGLARALALDPKILFYDEPSAGLDPVTSAQIDHLIIDLTKQLGVTSVVVTHEMDSAFCIADRMAMLDKGRMIRVAERAWYERLRDEPEERARERSDGERLIRQFLRGDADGPITERTSTDEYKEALFGPGGLAGKPTPSVQATRRSR